MILTGCSIVGFSGAELNTCYNAADCHVENGRAEQSAIIYDSPVTGTKRKISYRELRELVARFAGVLKGRGVTMSDRVVICMPMVPEAVVAMLAYARIEAIHSVVFGGFAPNELAKRINDAKPKLIVSASCRIEGTKVIPYKPMLDAAIESVEHIPMACIIYQRFGVKAELSNGRDFDWDTLMADVSHYLGPRGCTDPLYILYTSVTTGMPKGVVRDSGGHAVALKWSMKNLYDMKPGEVLWAPVPRQSASRRQRRDRMVLPPDRSFTRTSPVASFQSDETECRLAAKAQCVAGYLSSVGKSGKSKKREDH